MVGLTTTKGTQHYINIYKSKSVMVYTFLSLWPKWVVSQESKKKIVYSIAMTLSGTPEGSWSMIQGLYSKDRIFK